MRRLVRTTLASRGLRAGEIGVLLADDRVLRALNRRYRGLDRATDVLSFGYDDSSRRGSRRRWSAATAVGGLAVSGDLAVSLERVAEQARRFRCTRGEELARLVVHGALHLAGLDHKTRAERREMRAAEATVLRRVRAEVGALERGLGRARAERSA